ncbi:PEP/pyruvate-binding domain-containing protein [Leifsonia sp. NPDC102414]|uniref:PEP/pyruvate-binding domain-containing protein n=1 Tax=Leifsonia sp. NPDC102414 TaxID=3364124 RepID=UPI00381B94F5
MSEYTVRLGEHADPLLLGGKGANLSALVDAGFPVPDGFVVTTAAYVESVEEAGLAGAEPDALRTGIPNLSMPDRIVGQIVMAYEELGSPVVAVRSSGTAEDLAGASFAGQHDSYLNVHGADAVVSAIRDCWASLWTTRAVAYRDRFSWDEQGLALAVVVQRMVDAEWAGVMFTADPVSGRRDRIVVEAVRGLGEALVSGEATGEHFEVDTITGAQVAGHPAIPRAAVRQLVALGRDVEQRFGTPQDIEWTYANGRCALVQARPLTALPEAPPSGPAEAGRPSMRSAKRSAKRDADRLTNSLGTFAITADHMPYPPFPMDVSLVFRPALGAVLGSIASAGFTSPTLDDVLVEIDDGVTQIAPPRIRPTWRAIWRVPAVLPKALRLMRTRTADWNARTDESFRPLAHRLDTEDLTTVDDSALIARVHELIDTVGSLMPSRFGALIGGMAAEATAAGLLRWVVGRDRVEALRADLMSGVPCVMTSTNADLERIAAIVRATPELRDVYRTEEPADIAARLRESEGGRSLLAEVDDHLRAYGYRSVSIFTVGLPPLRDAPWIVHGFIKSLAGLEQKPDRAVEVRLARARNELAAEPGWRAGVARPIIDRQLRAARSGAGFRDDSQYVLEIALAVARRILLELGGRLTARGALASPDDIAYLTIDELAPVSNETSLRLVEQRKAARIAALDDYTVIPAELFIPADADGRVRGMPASRGRVVGRVRIIHDEAEFATLQAGEILVCPFTNPTWTPLFSIAAAVVVDSGGAASHAAIVAREVGIPAIMGTGNGTRILSDGQRVLVDAERGIVVPIGVGALTEAMDSDDVVV